MMTFQDKYVTQMNAIKLDDKTKEKILHNVLSVSTISENYRFTVQKRFAVIAAACFLIMLIAFVAPPFMNQKDHQSPSLVQSLILTAYAADGSPIPVKPDVTFPLGRYSVLMSSTPGFPITINSKDADSIRLHASTGRLLLWNPADSKITPLNSDTPIAPGNTVYWTPLEEGNPPKVAAEGVVELTLYKNGRVAGKGKIEITSDKSVDYKGKFTYN
ncbi:hypothetical protein PaecuDRAFT_3695 [Paenibacillus curdlanolyticus YK9]|uniref:Uncharacterized protein n=1 Tax=Paenibacillus curdlanolyticus YK9 TaxID=717606 RepID=E0IDJ1_9BACL|nr:hypothetical protein [Paenibacillus curdlanolyticus]EFM09646.1 hypothetical protein PaecuDRAFT_3695 [Paenibacillus curdlanolyticus YK9]